MFNLSKYQNTLPPLQENEASLEFLIPQIVLEWGELVGSSSTSEAFPAYYREISSTVAHLLGLMSITKVDEEATSSVKTRWAETVNPWVALGARVEALHRAWRQGETESLPRLTETLWAALEYRCKALTGKTLDEVLS